MPIQTRSTTKFLKSKGWGCKVILQSIGNEIPKIDTDTPKLHVFNSKTILELIKEVENDSFLGSHCGGMILDYWRQEKIYGLTFKGNIIPCFLTIYIYGRDKYIIDNIWVHPNYRRKGYARKLIEETGINRLYEPQENSLEFFKAVGLEEAYY